MGLGGESLQIPGHEQLVRTHSFVSPLYPMLLKATPIFQAVGALGDTEEQDIVPVVQDLPADGSPEPAPSSGR